MVISHEKIVAFQTITNYSFWTFYISGKPVVYNNKHENTWVLGNTRFIYRVKHDISHSFTALTREISCATLEINLVFPSTHVLCSISLV